MHGKVQGVHQDNYTQLEFNGMHDETSHTEEKSKKLSYKQIIAIHVAVIVAPNQSATTLPSNLQDASPEKHIPLTHLRSIQRRRLAKQKRAHDLGNCRQRKRARDY